MSTGTKMAMLNSLILARQGGQQRRIMVGVAMVAGGTAAATTTGWYMCTTTQQQQWQHLFSSNTTEMTRAATASAAALYEEPKQSSLLSSSSSTSSLVLPTLGASIRALRLVKTACQIVLEYQSAKLGSTMKQIDLDFWKTTTRTTTANESTTEIQQLEQNVERLGHELEQAQLEYTTTTPNLSPPARQQLIHEQKHTIETTATALALAEERLIEHEKTTSNRSDASKSSLHRKAAQRILELCRVNGGVYIKLGQHLANLDYLIPREYIDVLSSLFDDAPQSSIDDVHQVILEDFPHIQTIPELFDDFDPVPIASASLAQVHVAYDKHTHRKLAVKVQHRGLRESSQGDILAVTTVVNLLDTVFEEFTFGWIADEMAPQLPKELDFQQEGKNSERAAVNLLKVFGTHGSGNVTNTIDVCIPKVVWETTSSRVLTMEFEEGFKATDTVSIEESGLKNSDVGKLVSSVFNSQVFLSGFVHCDPHPGNCLIRPSSKHKGKPEMVLVDHGLYKTIDDQFRIQYAELWQSLMLADLEGIQTSCKGLGVTKMYPLFAAMLTARPYDEIMERAKSGSLMSSSSAKKLSSSASSSKSSDAAAAADHAVIRGYANQYLGDIMSLLGTLPRQMLLLLKMNDCLRHIDMALDAPTNNSLVIAGKYASQAVYQHRIALLSSSQQQDQEQHPSSDKTVLTTTTTGTSSTTTQIRRLASIKYKFQHWLDYMHVLFRIQMHDVGVWILSSNYSNYIRRLLYI